MGKHVIDGLIVKKIDYSETSVILQILTAEEGLKSFIFQGAKRKNKKGNLIQPLALLSIDYYQRNDSELAKISSIEPAVIYKTIPFDPFKSSVVFFVNEILSNTLKSEEQHTELYEFVTHILQVLDLTESYANFPIKFLYHYTKYLGFLPNMVAVPTYLNLQDCTFTSNIPMHKNYLSKELTALLLKICREDFSGKNDPPVSRENRQSLLNALISYYHIVFDSFKPLKSTEILAETIR
jgi:DNA repair protein RecO (recombination protein O)